MNIRKPLAVLLSVLLLLPSLAVGVLPASAGSTALPAVKIGCYGSTSQYYSLTTSNLAKGETYTLSLLWQAEGSTYSLSAYGSALGNTDDKPTLFAIGTRASDEPGLTFNPDNCTLTYTFVAQGSDLTVCASLATGSGGNAAAYLADMQVRKLDGTAVYTQQAVYTDGVLTGFVDDADAWGSLAYCSFVETTYDRFYSNGPIDATPACIHTYDDQCDPSCNACGAVRATPPHVYDDHNDTACNECAAVRPKPTMLPTAYLYYYAGASNQYYHNTVTGLKTGATYTLSMLYTCSLLTPVILVDGVTIIEGTTAQNGASYNTATGLLTYSFTAKATSADVRFTLAGSGYAGGYIAGLTVADANGSVVHSTTGVYSGSTVTDLYGWEDVFGNNQYFTFSLKEYGFFGAADPAVCNHTYDNACDSFCDDCGTYRVISDHVYETVCDQACAACGAMRDATGHQYDNACDNVCNVCQTVRIASAHTYSNACDTICNSCGAVCTSAHVYDSACDTDCNSCGALLEANDHVYTDTMDAVCNRCGYSRAVVEYDTVSAVPALRLYAWGGVTQGYGVNITDLVPGKTYTLSFLWNCVNGSYSVIAYGDALGNDWDTKHTLMLGNTAGSGVTYDEKFSRYTYTFTAVGSNMIVMGYLGSETGSGYKEVWLADVCVKDPVGTTVYATEGVYTDGTLTGFANASSRWGSTQYCFFEEKPYDFFNTTPDYYEALSSLTVAGHPFYFDPLTYTYDLTVPAKQSSLDLSYSLGADAAGTAPTVSGNSLTQGSTTAVTIAVKTADGTTVSYTINVYRRTADETVTAIDFKGGNAACSGSYGVSLTPGKTYRIEFLYKDVKGDKVCVTLGGRATLGKTISVVSNGKAGEGVTVDPDTGLHSCTFTTWESALSIRVSASNYAENNTTDAWEGWVADFKLYEIDPASGLRICGTDVVIDNTFSMDDPDTTDKEGNWTRPTYGGNTYWNVTTVSRSFFKDDYAASLNSILVNGDPIAGFHAGITTYAVALPYTTKTLTIAPTLGSDGSSAVVYDADGSAVSDAVAVDVGEHAFTVAVTNADGTVTTYTLSVTVEEEPAPQLTELGVAGRTLSPAFDPAVLYYDVTIPYTQDAIALYYRGTYANSTVQNGTALPVGTTPVTITLENTSGKRTTYVIRVHREAYTDRVLSDTLVQLAGGTVLKADPNAHVLQVLQGTTVAQVAAILPAKDGFTYTYYDEEWSHISEEYHDTAVIRDGFCLDVHKDGELLTEWTFAVTDTLGHTAGALAEIIDPTVVRVDEATNSLIVPQDLTIADVVAALSLSDDVALNFYNADGLCLPAKRYTSTIADGYTLQILMDGRLCNEWRLTVSANSDMTDVGILDVHAKTRTVIVRSGTKVGTIASLMPSLQGIEVVFFDANGNTAANAATIIGGFSAQVLKNGAVLSEWTFDISTATACSTHTYESPCDDTCQICGETRENTHSCDSGVCSRCCREVKTYSFTLSLGHGAGLSSAYLVTVTVANESPTYHEYDNDCDATCNNCGATRNAGEHVYANGCDSDCDVCGAIRTTLSHVYDGYTDTDCIVCGAVRDANAPFIVIDDITAKAGDTIAVPIRIINNPGIISMAVTIDYDSSCMEMVSTAAGDFNGVSFGPIGNDPFKVTWVDGLTLENNTTNGILATITFKVKDDAADGNYPITVTYDPENILNFNLETVDFDIQSGTVTVRSSTHVPGDVTGDGTVNVKDLVFLQRYLNDWDVEVDENALDVTGDGAVNVKDLVFLQRYLNDWDVTLY